MTATAGVRGRDRFIPPKIARPVVSRARLDPLFADARGCVVRVLAPAGYGKSTQVARWVESEPRHAGWIDIERVDNDAFLLLAAVAIAVGGPHGMAIESLPRTAQEQQFTSTVLPAFGELLRGHRTPFVLVLDDIHHLHDAVATSVVDVLIENLPDASTLVLVGRSHDSPTVDRLRLRRGVVDVTAGHLQFDLAETVELLASMGVALDEEDAAQLVATFEGWPAGLRLAGLLLRAGGTPHLTAVDEVGQARFVTDYLRSEWTGRLAAEDIAFMREVACLERFTAAQCDEVLGTHDSAARLRRMNREELLVLPLDQREEWYRMHPLLAWCLERDLRDSDGERWRSVHMSASAWWEAEDDIDLAIEHAVRCGAHQTAERLVVDHGGSYLTRGMHSTVERWLSHFTDEHVSASPGLCGIAAFGALHRSDATAASQWCRRLDRAMRQALEHGEVPDRIQGRAGVIHATIDTGPARDLIPLARRAQAQITSGPWIAMSSLILGGLLHLAGDPGAEEAFATGAFEARASSAHLLEANCLAAAAIVAELRGDRERAATSAQEAREILRSRRSEHLPTTALVTSMSSLLEARNGRRDHGVAELELSRSHLSGLAGIAPWFHVLSRLVLVRSSLLLDDHSTARTLLRELEEVLSSQRAGHGVVQQLAILRTMVDAASDLPSGASSLTAAEIRVLRFLPTNLSLADIATRLFVSRNTVKSHAAAIYRKLGTTSRRDAVELARDAGLLEEVDIDPWE